METACCHIEPNDQHYVEPHKCSDGRLAPFAPCDAVVPGKLVALHKRLAQIADAGPLAASKHCLGPSGLSASQVPQG